MKTHTIKNWMKYFAGTLAISGMLVLGGCDNSSNTTAVETEEGDPTGANGNDNGLGQPTRDNLSRENVNTRVYDDNGEGREVEANEDITSANEVIDERQESQQQGNLERANEDTLGGQYQADTTIID